MIAAYANSLTPAIWYVIPLFAIGIVATFFLPDVTRSNEAAIVARGEATVGD